MASDAQFKQAIMKYRSGDFLKARELLLNIKTEKYHPNKLDYNLGVINYKLGFYPSARQHFLHLKNNKKFKAIAYYNLSLIDIKLKDEGQALKWLALAYNHSSEGSSLQQLSITLKNKIINQPLSRQASSKILKTPVKAEPKLKIHKFKALIKSYTGYSNNVLQFNHGDSRNSFIAGDNFYILQIDSEANFSKHFKSSVSYNQTKYLKFSTYDTKNLILDLTYANRMRKWQYLLAVSYSNRFVNNTKFQNRPKLKTSLKRNISTNVKYIFALSYEQVSNSNPIYQYLNGDVKSVANTLKFSKKYAYYSLGYVYEQNDRNDFYSSGRLFSSFSPRTHFVDMQAAFKLYKSFNIQLTSRLGLHRFPTEDFVHQNYARKRVDMSSMFSLKTSYAMSKSLYLILSYEFYANESVLYDYRYSNNDYRLGFSWKI